MRVTAAHHRPRRDRQMPEAVIVDAIRTPIGRAAKGSLKSVRADDLAAIPLKALIERNPQLDQQLDRRRDDGLRLRGAASRATTSGASRRCWRASTTTCRAAPSTASAPPRCRPRAWPSTRSRRARATPTSRRASRRSRAPRRGASSSSTPSSTAREGSLYNVYIPMGMTAENVAERMQRQPRGAGRVGADLSDPRGRPRRSPGTSTRRSCR